MCIFAGAYCHGVTVSPVTNHGRLRKSPYPPPIDEK